MSCLESEMYRRHLNDKEINKNSRNFGDEMNSRCSKSNVRILFQNIRGFGDSEENRKTESIRQAIQEDNVDIMCMTEMNVNWKRVAKRKNLTQMSKAWFENSKVSIAYNYHQQGNKSKFQPGGSAIISKGSLSLRAIDFAPDQRRMGRWASQLFKGKDSIKTRIVTMYVPKEPDKHTFQRIYSQQQSALVKLGIAGSVQYNFWRDFWTQVDKWLEEGDQLVIAGDFNEDIRNPAFQNEFRKRQLIPAILNKHGPELPATHNSGKDPIDEIFVSSTIWCRPECCHMTTCCSHLTTFF